MRGELKDAVANKHEGKGVKQPGGFSDISLPGLGGLEPADVISTMFIAVSWAKGLRSHNVR
jgi:hypothetical protein